MSKLLRLKRNTEYIPSWHQLTCSRFGRFFVGWCCLHSIVGKIALSPGSRDRKMISLLLEDVWHPIKWCSCCSLVFCLWHLRADFRHVLRKLLLYLANLPRCARLRKRCRHVLAEQTWLSLFCMFTGSAGNLSLELQPRPTGPEAINWGLHRALLET